MEEVPASPMDSAQGDGTLMGRTETHGRPYPHLGEKFGVLLSIVIVVYLGCWMWSDSGWANPILWITSICGLPLLTMFLAEMFGKIVHTLHQRSE
ncbi:MAG: hypothetical protein QGF94_02185 [Candidatus Thalassarchaeaceae archaeon]|nr:hypothetical protein [Candidatus Thalassarchaeaceae archaeon]